MNENISTSNKIAVTLMVSAFVLSIIVNIIWIGMQFNNRQLDKYDIAFSEGTGSEIEQLAQTNEYLPAAVVYIALMKNHNLITSISGKVGAKNINKVTDLEDVLSVDILVSVTQNTLEGTYRIGVSD